MPKQASGTFDVQATPHPPYDAAPGATLGRLTLAKQFRGDLEATSTVEMLSAMSEVKGSAGYVAIERIGGALHGRTGTFVVQHSGAMTRGAPSLSISVVPDSGTGELTGISGTMGIDIVDGKHFYRFDYAIGAAE
jgi:hypothetical protein